MIICKRKMREYHSQAVTLVVGAPAVSFSMKSGIAIGPNKGVALRQSLRIDHEDYSHHAVVFDVPQSLLEIFCGYTIWIIRWRAERNWKITENDVEQILAYD